MQNNSLVSLSILICARLLFGFEESSDSADSADTPISGARIDTDSGSTRDLLKINEIIASAVDDGADWIELYTIADVANYLSTFYTFSEYQENHNSTVYRFCGLPSFINFRVVNMSQQPFSWQH